MQLCPGFLKLTYMNFNVNLSFHVRGLGIKYSKLMRVEELL